MTSVGSLRSTENSAANSGVTSTETTKAPEASSGDFDAVLRSLLTPNGANEVNEEELFAGLVQERLKASKGDEVATQYATALAAEKTKLQKADGYIPHEDAAKNALKSLRDSGALTTEEADKVYAESFDAAQLDDNKDALYDGRGGAGDPTIALSIMESALSSAKLLIDQFTAGTASAAVRTLDGVASSLLSSLTGTGATGDASAVPLTNTPTGTTFDGSNGFLFKPVSSNESKLAILLPEALAHQVLSVMVKDSSGNTLEEGRSTGYGEEGTREKFAFTKQGQEYPKDITVHAVLADGTERTWTIPDPSQRYD